MHFVHVDENGKFFAYFAFILVSYETKDQWASAETSGYTF